MMGGMKRFAEDIAAEYGIDDICDPAVILLGTLRLAESQEEGARSLREGGLTMKCPDCGGTGLAETELYEGLVNCPRCEGAGFIKILERQDLPDDGDEI